MSDQINRQVWLKRRPSGIPQADDFGIRTVSLLGFYVGQIAGLHGCRTVGITGGSKKAAWCRDFYHYDAAIDSYRSISYRSALVSLDEVDP